MALPSLPAKIKDFPPVYAALAAHLTPVSTEMTLHYGWEHWPNDPLTLTKIAGISIVRGSVKATSVTTDWSPVCDLPAGTKSASVSCTQLGTPAADRKPIAAQITGEVLNLAGYSAQFRQVITAVLP